MSTAARGFVAAHIDNCRPTPWASAAAQQSIGKARNSKAAAFHWHRRRLFSADGALASFAGQILVFHFPGVIERVKRGVPNQVTQRPRAGHFALGMQRPNGVAIGVAMRVQSLIGQYRVLRREHAELLRPVLLRGRRMTDNVVSISPAAARARTASKNAQHARISVSSRSNASSDMGCWSMLENANEIPQKSVEPVS